MADQIIPRNTLYVNFASVQTKQNRWRHCQNQQQNYRGEGCRHKYRIFTNEPEREFTLYKDQSKQRDTPKINCSKSTVYLTII